MSNEIKDFTIKLRCNEAFYRALVLMLRYASKLGFGGSSRLIAIYFDGDGSDGIKALDISEPVPESDKGIVTEKRFGTLAEDRMLDHRICMGDFILDTDEVFRSIEG